jgi:hypothetical protein
MYVSVQSVPCWLYCLAKLEYTVIIYYNITSICRMIFVNNRQRYGMKLLLLNFRHYPDIGLDILKENMQNSA